MSLGVEYGCPYVLTGPDGTRAVFNDESDPDFVGVLSPETSGLDSPDIREEAVDVVEGDGGVHGDFFAGRRPVVLQGTVLALTKTQRNERVERLQRASLALRGDATLAWEVEGGEPVTLKLRRQQPVRITGGYVKAFQVPLVAADPRIYSASYEADTNVYDSAFITGLADPYGIDVDDTYIYWADLGGAGNIGRAKLDGTSVDKEFITGLADPYGVAVDDTYIYWAAPGGAGNIGRAKLDGTSVDKEFITEVEAYNITVDGSYIYWPSGPETGNIGRAKLDGTSVNAAFITAPIATWGIAVDETYIYWSDLVVESIGRAKLDGTSIDNEFMPPFGGGENYDVTVDEDYIYWSNGASFSTIGRANLDGTSIDNEFITGPSYVYGVTTDNQYLYWSTSTGFIGRTRLDATSVIEVSLAGSATASPQIKLTGPVTDPTITNETAGETFALNYTLTKGNYIIVDFKRKTVLLNGVTDLSYAVDFPNSEWWELRPGENIISFSPAATAEITYQSAWL